MSSLIFHLEMRSRADFCPTELPRGLEVRKLKDPKLNARFYREVGKGWEWTDRLAWSPEQWREWALRDELRTLVAYFQGEEAGYAELERQEGDSVELVYFGLLPGMIGKGLGAAMLSLVVEEAWADSSVQRVWLHTCTEDHPHARANYEGRGFSVFKTESG